MTERQPTRIQMSRATGWRKPAGAVYVGRPSRWGNPFKIGPAITCQGVSIPEMTAETAVECYRAHITRMLQTHASVAWELEALRGRDLLCWCKLDAPCHGDVLLELANAPPKAYLE